MADGSSNNFLAFILGGVVVMLVIVGIVVFNGGEFGGNSTSAVKVEVPNVTK
jgi:hypothetical protein